jgi:hypothetical protein
MQYNVLTPSVTGDKESLRCVGNSFKCGARVYSRIGIFICTVGGREKEEESGERREWREEGIN